MKCATLAFGLLALVACGTPAASTEAHPRSVPPPNLARLADNPPPGYLVWTGGVGGETVWLDADGAERGRAAGVVIALRATLWKLGLRQERYQVSTCTKSHGKPGPRGDGSGWMDAEIQELTAIERRDDTYPLNSTWWSGSGVAGTEHHAVITGQVGRFVFLTERTESETCLDEPAVAVVGRTFDLVRGYANEPLVDGDAEERLRTTARTALIAELVAAGDRENVDAYTYLGDTRPTWRDGALALEHLFFMHTCATCGDRDWTSATVATWVPAASLPGALAEYVDDLPAPVRARLSSATGPVGVTWGYPDELWRKTFR